MPRQWTETTALYLLNTTMCPRCNADLSEPSSCRSCRADLSGPDIEELYAASKDAAFHLRRREALIDALPVLPLFEAAPSARSVAPGPIATPARSEPPTSSPISVQSVLAMAGAGLFAVAAIVFTFFNPDLTNFATRTAIIAVITVVFIAGALLLARRGLQFSAEAIGALAAVFVALDVWALSSSSPGATVSWLSLSLGVVAASLILVTLAIRVRLRTWLWTGLVGVTLSPVLFSLAFDTPWATALGWVAVGFATRGAHAVLSKLFGRFESPLMTDRVTATVTLGVALLLGAGELLVAATSSPGSSGILPAALVVAIVSVLCAASASTLIGRFWSFAAGGLFVCATALAAIAAFAVRPSWLLAVVSGALTIGVAIVVLAPPRFGIDVTALRRGAWTVALTAGIPALIVPLTQFTAAIGALAQGRLGTDLLSWDGEFSMAATLSLFATALSALVLSRTRRGAARDLYRPIAASIAVTALLSLASWAEFLPITQALLSLGFAAAITLALLRVPRLAAEPLAVRAVLLLGVHLLIILGGVVSWASPDIRVPIGVVAAACILLLARAMPAVYRSSYLGAAYAYGLGILAAALALAGLELIAVLCLTTSVAALAALVATITPWLSSRAWYAVLAVTAVPFAIGVISVLAVRSGWTGLSTAVTFALLLTLVATKREGMTRLMRTASASLLVPALAVVVICLGAEVLAVSASPITLPVIALIVAVVLPASRLVSLPDARYVRAALEIGALTTGVLAVLLALVRAAAGIPTTFLVLLILGIGSIATAIFGQRRYGWPLAGASLTGALWCVWALAGVTEIEPYLLPPALGVALVGALLVARDRPGMGLSAIGLFWTGLSTATLVPLAVLTGVGSGDALVPWRAIGILAGSVVLIATAAYVPRLRRVTALRRIGPLRTPMLVIAVVAAAAGALQAVRFGRGLDGAEGIVPTLVATLVAVVLAVIASRLLASDHASADPITARIARSRALYVPAVLYLVLGPIVAIRPGWFPILTLLGLTLVLLALMIVTAVRSRTRAVTLPPVAFLFPVAWCTAVASWSERELRVEAYSLPLGVALLAVGIIGMIPTDGEIPTKTLRSWPHGFSGSWQLLAPGLLVILVPSVLATATDPLTLRAIFVIAFALLAILIGNKRRLAAPFILGIIVLPIENVVVFAVQLGQSISALPWWITLATAGAVLLVLAVSSERRTGDDRGAAARIRDLA